ncbi:MULTISPECIES: hypothetical protein [Pseudothermotoga]|uniref:Uncharacterized protein n=1 Tax=Pseudothermotoga lettingae (strain ATCC BAA-301 / DSM 14385 / NBRC 107922 / TMO) TaxID=416591 RepID=A8F887_PSELT|nr:MULTISPECIES: hypothetical protein [Pseudothermotoga]ABV34371.1 hypothetical protein Tlet_1817 [Pseudothermotoga lettingae TMO]KUK21044.1 MAG: Uncharacterized protein XD56_1043 [Pseudothermotoga lettingae]GLI48684.1 hypothetical protein PLETTINGATMO_08530 [Pseudothermotoga lettingae TMO]
MAEKQKKKGRLKAFLKIIIVALFVSLTILIYGYFVFEYSRIKGLSANPVEDWKSYISFLLSKIPYVDRYVKYEPLQILSPSEYFEEISRAASTRAQQILEEAKSAKSQAEEQLKLVEAERKIVLQMRKEWEEKMLQLEANTGKLQSTEDIKKITETISSADPTGIAPVLASNAYTVDSIAAALSNLSPDLRADVLTELGKINPEKAAQVMNKIASVEEIISSLNERERQIEEKQKQLVNELSLMIDAKIIKDLSFDFIKQFTDEQILQMIDSLSLDENSVMIILTSLESERSKEILKRLKDEKPGLFQKLVLKGVSL